MSDPQPAPAARFNTNAWWFLLGLVIFGVFGFVMFFVGTAAINMVGNFALALLMILATGGAAFWAIRAGRVALGSGLLIGYAVAAVASGGQCTYLVGTSDYGFLGGALIYLYGTALLFVVAIGALIVSLVTRGMRGGQ
jgi:hypothetical protein